MKSIFKHLKTITVLLLIAATISCSKDDTPEEDNAPTMTTLEVVDNDGNVKSFGVDPDKVLTDSEGFAVYLVWAPDTAIDIFGNQIATDLDLYMDAELIVNGENQDGLLRYYSESSNPGETILINNNDDDSYGMTAIWLYEVTQELESGTNINYQLSIVRLSNDVTEKVLQGSITYDSNNVDSQISILDLFIKSGDKFYFEY